MIDLLISSKDLNALKRMTLRQIFIQIVCAAYSLMGTYMLLKFIGLLLNNDSPIAVVPTESMYPGFERGDILFLSPRKNYDDYVTGDMIVFQVKKNEIPIVHRAIRRFGSLILTKGDNNRIDDVSLYRPGQNYLTEKDVLSRVVARLPYFGMITIWVNAVPNLKIIAMAMVGLSVFLKREE